jgi:regulatory protein
LRPSATDPDSPAAARAAGFRALARRELSVAQLRDRLKRRGYTAHAIDDAIARLLDAGALDDERVARAAARTSAQVKRHGRARVARELTTLGIPRDVADRALDEVFDAVDEQALLRQALRAAPARLDVAGRSASAPAGLCRARTSGIRTRCGPASAESPRRPVGPGRFERRVIRQSITASMNHPPVSRS